MDFAVLVDHRVKLKEREKKDKYKDFARELKKTVEHEGDNYTNCNWCFWYSCQGLEDLEIRGRVESIQTTAFIEIVQNPEKSPGDSQRFAVTQTPVKYHQLTLK